MAAKISRDATIGWMYVGIQAILLFTLIFLPSRGDWSTSGPVRFVGLACIAVGFVAMGGAAIFLGRSLTATPVPVAHGQLKTTGLYRFVRHPIYTGVLAVVVGLTIGSGSWIGLGVGAATVLFFNNKARWEERQLAKRYAGYDEYANATPRFIPRLW